MRSVFGTSHISFESGSGIIYHPSQFTIRRMRLARKVKATIANLRAFVFQKHGQ